MSTNAKSLLRPFLTTGIGTLPHTSVSEAVEAALQGFDIPFWPQLPSISFLEQMVPQYSEGIPFVKVDEKGCKIWIERDSSDELDRFYETCSGEECVMAISEHYARGLHGFLKAVTGRRFRLLKGHVTGPLTFTLGLNDTAGRPVFYDEELREICLLALNAKAKWQVEMLGAHADGVIIFIDEPILSALGSTTYMGVSREEALRMLSSTVEAVRSAGAVAGMHCCGRAEWPLVMESGPDIMNFDAYEYGDTLAIYPKETAAFLDKGGWLAWGVVPTTDAIARVDEKGVRSAYDSLLDGLSKDIDRDLLLERIILTPACGTGSRSVSETLKVFQLLMRLKEELVP